MSVPGVAVLVLAAGVGAQSCTDVVAAFDAACPADCSVTGAAGAVACGAGQNPWGVLCRGKPCGEFVAANASALQACNPALTNDSLQSIAAYCGQLWGVEAAAACPMDCTPFAYASAVSIPKCAAGQQQYGVACAASCMEWLANRTDDEYAQSPIYPFAMRDVMLTRLNVHSVYDACGRLTSAQRAEAAASCTVADTQRWSQMDATCPRDCDDGARACGSAEHAYGVKCHAGGSRDCYNFLSAAETNPSAANCVTEVLSGALSPQTALATAHYIRSRCAGVASPPPPSPPPAPPPPSPPPHPPPPPVVRAGAVAGDVQWLGDSTLEDVYDIALICAGVMTLPSVLTGGVAATLVPGRIDAVTKYGYECRMDDAVDLRQRWVQHPLRFEVLDSNAAGTAAGNGIIGAGVLVLHLIVAALASVDGSSTNEPAFPAAAASVMFPALGAAPGYFLVPGTGAAAAYLLFHASSDDWEKNVVGGAAAGAIVILLVVTVAAAFRSYRACGYTPRPQSFCDVLTPAGDWASCSHRRRWFMVFEGQRGDHPARAGWAGVEVFVQILLAALGAMRGGENTCVFAGGAQCGILFLHGLSLALLRPMRYASENVGLFSSSLAAAVSAGCYAAAFAHANDAGYWAYDAAATAAVVAQTLAAVRGCVAVCCLVRVCSERRDLRRGAVPRSEAAALMQSVGAVDATPAPATKSAMSRAVIGPRGGALLRRSELPDAPLEGSLKQDSAVEVLEVRGPRARVREIESMREGWVPISAVVWTYGAGPDTGPPLGPPETPEPLRPEGEQQPSFRTMAPRPSFSATPPQNTLQPLPSLTPDQDPLQPAAGKVGRTASGVVGRTDSMLRGQSMSHRRRSMNQTAPRRASVVRSFSMNQGQQRAASSTPPPAPLSLQMGQGLRAAAVAENEGPPQLLGRRGSLFTGATSRPRRRANSSTLQPLPGGEQLPAVLQNGAQDGGRSIPSRPLPALGSLGNLGPLRGASSSILDPQPLGDPPARSVKRKSSQRRHRHAAGDTGPTPPRAGLGSGAVEDLSALLQAAAPRMPEHEV